MTRIALVEYINTRPFLDGLERNFSSDEISLHLLPPMDCARALQEGTVDLALMPVGALTNFEHLEILPEYCIGAQGPVNSVFLYAQQPVETLHTVILDRHSRSSNGLLRILMHHHWQQPVSYEMPASKHFDRILGGTGGVVIGDQAMRIRDQFAYAYDLSEAWHELTGLPFAFAVWAHHPGNLDERMRERLYLALRDGVENRKQTAINWSEYFQFEEDFAIEYLTRYIDFPFTPAKHRALKLYLKKLVALPQLKLQAL